MSHRKFDQLFEELWSKKVPFFGVFFVIMFFSYGFLYSIDFIPEAPENPNAESRISEFLTDSAVQELESNLEAVSRVETAQEEAFKPRSANPKKIIIDRLDREVAVLNPEVRTVAGLDNALLSGVVRHPDSADFTTQGTMFLFGHSSYLPNVLNKNFQAFNGIQDLEWGDTIRLQSGDAEYVYRVDRVYKAKASNAEVEIDSGEQRLTLATCNSFGSKDDRHIVESTLVEVRQLKG